MATYSKAVALLLAVAASSQILSNPLASAAQAPRPRSRSEIEAVLAKAPKPPAEDKLRALNIVLVADKKDHGVNEHDYPLWQKRWAVLLGGKGAGGSTETQVNLYGPPPSGSRDKELEGAHNIRISLAAQWPTRQQLKKADLIVMFCYGRWNEQRLKELEEYLNRGGGFVAVHPAVITDRKLSQKLAGLIGLAWENGYTRWRHGHMDLKIAAQDHPICLGLPKKIHLLDEAYWPLKGDLRKVQVLATSKEAISKDSTETKPEPMFYAYRCGRGRAFCCILGHYTWTFDDPYFRILLLRGMAWAAGESPYRFDRLVLRGVPLNSHAQ